MAEDWLQLEVYFGDSDGICPSPLRLRVPTVAKVKLVKEKLFETTGLSSQSQVLVVNEKVYADYDTLVPPDPPSRKIFVYMCTKDGETTQLSYEQLPGSFRHEISQHTLSTPREDAQIDPKPSVPPPVPRPTPTVDHHQIFLERYGWECPKCTCLNEPTRLACDICLNDRPETFKMPDKSVLPERDLERLKKMEKEALELAEFLASEKAARAEEARLFREEIMQVDNENNCIPNCEMFKCPICDGEIAVGEGVMLRGCTHTFCRDCLVDEIRNCTTFEVRCPGLDAKNKHVVCGMALQHREIRGILEHEPGAYEERLRREVAASEMALRGTSKSFHCLTQECRGWVFYEAETAFKCPVCEMENCIACKAQHAPISCKDFQQEQARKQRRHVNEAKDNNLHQEMIRRGEAMKCPGCQIIIVKNGGCFFVKCTQCKMEICWGTKGPRWGPKGRGDNTGGCKCDPKKPNCVPGCPGCTYQ